MRAYPQSQELFARACQVTPGGAQTGSKAPGRVGPLGAFPLYIRNAKGSEVEDVDGHLYVDWFNGNCAVTLGHRHPAVLERVQYHLERTGALPSLPTVLEARVASRLAGLIPCADQVRFLKTGSEACAAAVRIARIATGRELLAVCQGHYHGWHDWTVVRNEFAPGVPSVLRHLVKPFRYNDLVSLERVLVTHRIAAVMLEPTLVDAPDPGFLQGIIALAHAHGAVVIFDEMICGARWAIGGAQAYFGVTPDLATFGKAFANGFPLAFVAGRGDLMQHAWPISGTFGGEVTGLAACDAVLDEMEMRAPINAMWAVGQPLMDGVNGICARLELPARMVGYPVHPVLRWQFSAEWLTGRPYAVRDEHELEGVIVALFQQELAQRGVLAHPSGWNPSAAHDSRAIAETIVPIDGALQVVKTALESGEPRAFLRGELLTPAFARAEASAS